MPKSKTVCLVRPLLSKYEQSAYPMELLILASAIRKEGFNPTIIDFEYLKTTDPIWKEEKGFTKRAAAEIVSTGCSYVGLTAICSNYVLALDIAHEIKKLSPHTHITLGGPQVTMCYAETMDCSPQLDSIVVGEGEFTYPDLLNSIEQGSPLENVPGICFRKKNGSIRINEKRPLLKDLSHSPNLAFDLIDLPGYLNLKNIGTIYAGSGCPFNCTFCTTSLVWERKYRIKPVERIIEEIKELHYDYGVTHFDFVHDNLTSNKKFIILLCESIKSLDFEITFELSSRIDTLNEETARIAAEAGCTNIFFGIESASKKTQQQIGKRLKVAQIPETLNYCLKYGIAPTAAYIIGFPEEEQIDINKTIKQAFQSKIVTGESVVFNMIKPLTGSALFNNSKDKLYFDRSNLPSDQSYYLEEKHIDDIENNHILYPNYYYLDYNHSFFKAKDYQLLLDFLTILIVKNTYTLNALITDLLISPLSIFEHFREKLAATSREKRDKLFFSIDENDLRQLLEKHHISFNQAEYALSAHQYDFMLDKVMRQEFTSQETNQWVLFEGKLNLLDNELPLEGKIFSPQTRYYLLANAEGRVLTCEIDKSEYEFLYQLQMAPEKASQSHTHFRGLINECAEIGISL